ncbi:MAG TPA: hypothetical protein DEF85_04600, partial [Clostridiaceae bacterium]|nr:hypothetical protein [Clostridiaceae bacterium]
RLFEPLKMGDIYISFSYSKLTLSAFYKVLDEVIDTYYNNHDKWVEMMRNSILSIKDEFSVKRMLKDYYSKMYIR